MCCLSYTQTTIFYLQLSLLSPVHIPLHKFQFIVFLNITVAFDYCFCKLLVSIKFYHFH